MTDSKAAEINLKSVQRIDREALSIISQATHVALYRFDMATSEWRKDEVEGPLFVYRRSAEPYYSFLIANRQSPQDFILYVTSELALKDQPPYIFLYRPNGLINGLWFSRDTDGKRFYDLINKLIANPQSVDVDSFKAKEPRAPSKKPPQMPGPVHGHAAASPVKKEPVNVMDRLHAAAANNKKSHAAVVQAATQPTTSTERSVRQPDVKPTVDTKKVNAQHAAKKTVSAAASASSVHSEPVQNGVTLLKRDSIRESPTGAGLTRDQAIEAIEHMLR
ncbi:Dcp1-like decapping family protein, partial [Aphelenchoides avenae]